MKKGKRFFGEFKEFISRGSVLDMAVGVVVGSAFTAIVTSLVNDMIMPLIAKLIGGLNFSSLKIVLTPAAGDVAETAIYYGSFIQTVVNFLIISFVIFVMIKQINRLRRKKEEEPAAEPAPDPQLELLSEIRDLLREQNETRQKGDDCNS